MLIFFRQQASSPQSVFAAMQSQADLALTSKRSKFNPVQIDSQIPSWLKQETNNKVSGMAQFLQAYYDWLTNSYGYTGVNVMDISDLVDIDETPEFLLSHFIETYAPDIKGIYNLAENERPTETNIRNTIKNIRTELYQRKSTEEAFRSLMGSLFSIDPETIQFSYPKRKILRLNAGILDWMVDSTYYGATGEYSSERYTVVGSHLNQGVMPDGKMWQEFSYLLTSEIDDSNPYYEAVVKETLHPAGLLGLYEKVETYSEGGYDPGPVVIYESPRISNYYPYTLGSTGTLNKCSGCTGPLFKAGWTFPTFVYPGTWDEEIINGPSANFGSIIIKDFYQLNSILGFPSPNDNIGTTCGFPCGICGSVEYAWSVGVGEQFEGDAYTEIPIPEFFSPDGSIELEDPGTPP